MTTTGISRTPYLPAELRIPIYRAYNLSNKWFLRHPRQTFYKGAQLDPQASVEVGWGQSYVSVSDDSSTGDTACSALTLAEIGLHPREYRYDHEKNSQHQSRAMISRVPKGGASRRINKSFQLTFPKQLPDARPSHERAHLYDRHQQHQ